MEHTRGLGNEAQVWVQGVLLTVCDNVSPPGRRRHPGKMEEAKFAYVAHEGFTWAQAVAGNPAQRKRLDHVRGWSYVGYGQVIGIMPVRIDFGLTVMEDANWTSDESLVGRYVRVDIDRLDLVPTPHTPPSED